MIQSSLVQILNVSDDKRLLERVRGIVRRFIALSRRLRDVSKWRDELDACKGADEARERITAILGEIEQSLNPQPLALSYLRDALGAGERDLVVVLDSAVKRGLALTKTPPSRKEIEIIAPDLVVCVTVADGDLSNNSTEKLLSGYRATFQTIVYEGLPRPKLWILPTLARQKVVVAMGRPDVVDRLLKSTFHHNSLQT